MRDSVMRFTVECAALYACGNVVRYAALYALGGKSSPLAWNASGLAATAVWFGYVYWRDWASMWRWGKPSPWALVLTAGLLVGFAAGRGSFALTQAGTRAAMILRPSQSIALEVCLLAPIREEVFWRGFLLRRLAALTGLWPALAVSGLLFGIIGHTDPTKAAVMGIFLGLLYSPLGTGHLAAAMVFHALVNLTSTIPPWAPMGL